MIDIDSYADFCGPRAVAALAGLPDRHSAAVLLANVAAEHARIDWIEDSQGTAQAALLAALRRLGYTAEPYDAKTGEPTGESAETYYERLLAARPPRDAEIEAARTLIESAPLAERPALHRAYYAGIVNGEPTSMTVQQFVWRFPRDSWLLMTRARWPHFLAIRFARPIAGDAPGFPQYGAVPVHTALRIARMTA